MHLWSSIFLYHELCLRSYSCVGALFTDQAALAFVPFKEKLSCEQLCLARVLCVYATSDFTASNLVVAVLLLGSVIFSFFLNV